MARVVTIDPGKSKCGLVLAEISDKSTFILKDESILLKTLNCFNTEFKNKNKFKITLKKVLLRKKD